MKTIKQIMFGAMAIAIAGSFASFVHADSWDFGAATLRVGSSGQYVISLQTALDSNGATLTTDGHFGNMTKAAVEAFQQSHNLAADGVVGPMTRTALLATSVSTIVPPPIAITSPTSSTTTAPVSTTCDSVSLTTLSSGVSHTMTGIPALEVTGPAAGVSYNVGGSIPVTWKNCTGYTGTVSISLVASTGQVMPIATNLSAANLGYTFVVSSGDLVSGVSTYSILLTNSLYSNGQSVAGQSSSGTFTILPSVTGTAPMIQSMSNVTGSVGTSVTINGMGFLPTNTVIFGGNPITSTVNSAGTAVTFTVPANVPNIGSYTVTVQNANGTSNADSFTVTGLNG